MTASGSGSNRPKLTKLSVFNTSWGPREGEEEQKIVYFWPPETEINDQVKTVGLIEAVVRFGQTFSQQPTHSLHTQKTRTVWRQVREMYKGESKVNSEILCKAMELPCLLIGPGSS